MTEPRQPIPAEVRKVMELFGWDEMTARRHVEQQAHLSKQYHHDLRVRAAACVEAYAARSAGSIADVISLEHAAGDEAHFTGLPLEHCQQYVRRNAALVAELVSQDRSAS